MGLKAVTITRIGTNQKYAAGWDAAFARKGAVKGGAAKGGTSQKKAAPSKKSAGKKTTKKGKK
jgi:hypothetical protein